MSKGMVGVRNDLKEIGGSLKSGFNKLFLSLKQNDVVEKEEEEKEQEIESDDVAGISEETVKFVDEICSQPHFWTHFPLRLPHEFRMSEAQKKHVLNMERLVPGLGDLRSEVGEYVGEEQFWMVYFVLLVPRLTDSDAHILSTPQSGIERRKVKAVDFYYSFSYYITELAFTILETRSLLLQKLKNKSKIRVESAETSNSGMQKEKITSGDNKVTQIVNSMNRFELDDDENPGHWSECSGLSIATSTGNQRKHESEEDGSFSDLEDDLSSRSSSSIQLLHRIRAPSPSGSIDWVQLSETAVRPQKPRMSLSRDKDSDVESSDWLKVGDSD